MPSTEGMDFMLKARPSAKRRAQKGGSTAPDPDVWQSALAGLTAEMTGWEKWSWTTGGCFAFADAFQRAFGGELYGVCRPEQHGPDDDPEVDYPVDHAIVLLGGKFYDYEGEFDPSGIKPNQVIKSKADDFVCWFVDDFFDDRQMRLLRRVMRECAAGGPKAQIGCSPAG